MSKAKKNIAAIVGGSSDEVEAAFYEALQNADLERLMACWADDDEVACVHPGGPRMIGLGAIRSAFEAMFNNGSVRVRAEGVRKIEALGSAVHSVRERVELLTPEGPMEAVVIATNVYHKTAQGWRLVAHHASPGNAREPQDVTDTPPVLH
ncbi:nuclear transport factor 2 family protein [Rhodoferax sp.]|uniref:YybH family protein n=1 Tax=Rhodoferax sp. TaxID=50421 RepID=UPI002626FCA2|nr:nuclear transport factor 2 family protein [Rhodoferax sp.]MDD2920016.1 nuclear transport factor 2 family protein [Rhodoferax sp.]